MDEQRLIIPALETELWEDFFENNSTAHRRTFSGDDGGRPSCVKPPATSSPSSRCACSSSTSRANSRA